MFKFPVGYSSFEKKHFNQYYSIYQNSQDFIKSLFSSMGKINVNYQFDIRKIEFCPVSLDTIYFLVRDILSKEFNFYLLNLFDEMVKKNRIFFFDGNSTELFEKYGNRGFFCGFEKYLGKETPVYYGKKSNSFLSEYIYAPILEEVNDIWGIIHEINHFSSSDSCTNRGLLSAKVIWETLPIYSEFITLNYFLEHFPNQSCYFGFLMNRYDTITDWNEQFLETDYDFSKCEYEVEIFEEFKYLLGLLIASKLFYDYNLDPDGARYEYNFFANCLMEEDLNYIMKEIDMPIRLCNQTLTFTKNGLEKCMFYYEWALKYVHKHYMDTQREVVKGKNKVLK